MVEDGNSGIGGSFAGFFPADVTLTTAILFQIKNIFTWIVFNTDGNVMILLLTSTQVPKSICFTLRKQNKRTINKLFRLNHINDLELHYYTSNLKYNCFFLLLAYLPDIKCLHQF